MDELVVRSLGHSASASPSIASCALPRGQRVLQLAGAVDGEPNAIVSRGDGEQERAHAALAPRLIAARTHSSVHHVLLGMDGGAGRPPSRTMRLSAAWCRRFRSKGARSMAINPPSPRRPLACSMMGRCSYCVSSAP